MEKGIFTIVNPEYNAYAAWNSFQFVTDDRINELKNWWWESSESNEPKMYALIFDDAWKTKEYIEANPEMEWWVPFRIGTQKSWDSFATTNIDKDTNEMVLNRCILDETHECAVWSFKFSEYKNFEEFEKFIQKVDYCTSWYKNKYTDKDFKKI